MGSLSKLRSNSRNANFCNNITTDQFDDIVELLFNRQNPNYKESIDILAAMSNILLINRQLHSSYFTKKYSNQVLKYLENLVRTNISLDPSPSNPPADNYDFKSLVPIYRLIFLILYDRIDMVNTSVVEDIYSILVIGFKFCDGFFTKFKFNDYYKMTFTEILKSLYTLNHKYSYIDNMEHPDDLSNSVVLTLNQIFQFKKTYSDFSHSGSLLVKNLVNFLLSLLNSNHNGKFDYQFDRVSVKEYKNFFNNLITLMDLQLRNYYQECHIPEFELIDVHNLLVVMDLLLNQASQSYRATNDPKDQRKYLSLYHILQLGILPYSGSKAIYSKLVRLVAESSRIDRAGSMVSHTSADSQTSHSKHIILQLIFTLCWNPNQDQDSQVICFLDLVGFPTANPFLAANNIRLPNVEVQNFMAPNEKYIDKLIFDNTKIHDGDDLNTLFSKIDYSSSKDPVQHMTEEEKEVEAEKLFTVFDRMEKIGIFKNFQNPVREWQQLGKFEDLSG